jgi:RHS repeat-associated protein
MDAAGVIATYVMDGDRPLTAQSNGNTTFYLYGLGAIAEKTTSWNYSLPDRTNTPRQLSDINGGIILSARYTPWGDTLDTFGIGNFTFGYLGGVLDATTGLLYVGNGQYYDPATGRFLTRDVYPNSPNPYVPWNPIGAILGPLAVLSLIYGRKQKRGKWDTLFIIVLLGISMGIGIAACAPPPPAPNTNETAVPSATPAPSNPSPVEAPVSTGPATGTAVLPIATDSPTPIVEATPCATAILPGFLDAELQLYDVKFAGDLSEWTAQRIEAVREAVKEVAVQLSKTVGGTPIEVFRLVYEGLTFSWGIENALSGCTVIKTGGCTTDAHNINFVKLSGEFLRARNNVVHEMGHAFAKNWPESSLSQDDLQYFRYHPKEVNPAIVLAWAQSYQGLAEHYIAGFPDRQDPIPNKDGKYPPGNFLGFASEQNVLTWQIAMTKAGDPGEEFADQFLGWTFSVWRNSAQGDMRANFMNKYMPGWIDYRIIY